MKKIYITNEQHKLLKESIIISDLFNDTDSNPLINTEIFNGNTIIIEKILFNGLKYVTSQFSNDITSFDTESIQNKLNKLIAKCQKIESKNKGKLESLCCNTIIQLFSIDKESNISIDCKLTNNVSDNMKIHLSPDVPLLDNEFDNTNSIKNILSEINKRKIINSLTIGAAHSLYNIIINKLLQELFKINEELPHLYSQIVKINDYLLYKNTVNINDKNNYQCSNVNVKLTSFNDNNDNEVKIISQGIIFPFLLIETIRGILEYISDSGLPNNKDEKIIVIDNCDVLKNELWYTRVGIPMWNIIQDKIQDKTPLLNCCVFSNISQLNCEEFTNVMSEIINKTKLGSEYIKQIVDDAKQLIDFEQCKNELNKIQFDKEQLIIDNFDDDDKLLYENKSYSDNSDYSHH